MPKGPHAAPVRVLLLRPRDEACDVVHCWGILGVQSVGLALHARLVHQHAGIRVEPRQSEANPGAVVDDGDLADGPGVPQLGRGALFHRDAHHVLAHGLEGVLHLEEVPVRREDSDGTVVARHLDGKLGDG